ncbi:glycosyltransferase [Candidatus Parcubacteria bacterium]|nr:glycosyltransferase [Candidatus Parcubacteria bacterium]
MKIGIFSNFYPPSERGGAELVASRVAHELARRGHRVFVLSTSPLSRASDLHVHRVEEAVERVYRFFPLNLYHVSRAPLFPFPIRLVWHVVDLCGPYPHRQIDRLLEMEEPDVVFTHNLKGLGVRSARCIQQAGIRHIHTLHDVQLSIPSGVLVYGQEQKGWNRGVPRRWYEGLAKRALGRPDMIISPSAFLAEFYRSRGFFTESRLEILPNPAPSSRDALPARGRPTGALKFLFVGQLEVHKGVQLLLEAMHDLGLPYELHFVGEGMLSQEVQRVAHSDPRFFFHGFISLEHIRRLMAVSDAIILPSLCYENSPTVIYEAFQSGLPVITSKIGGIPELVEDGVNGLLFEPGNVASLRAAIRRFAQERDVFFSRTADIQARADSYALSQYVSHLEAFMG